MAPIPEVFQPIAILTLTKRTCTCLAVIVRAGEEGYNLIGSKRRIASAAVEESNRVGVLRRAASLPSYR
jgi:hypothetical protein